MSNFLIVITESEKELGHKFKISLICDEKTYNCLLATKVYYKVDSFHLALRITHDIGNYQVIDLLSALLLT